MGWREREAGADAARFGHGQYMNPHTRREFGFSQETERRRKERDWEDGWSEERRSIQRRADEAEEQRKAEARDAERRRDQERQQREQEEEDERRREEEAGEADA